MRAQIAIAIGVIALLAGLIIWQVKRDRLIADCLQTGGTWEGAQSQCIYPPGRILIRPDLKRG